MSGGHVDEGRLRDALASCLDVFEDQGYTGPAREKAQAALAAPLSASEAQGICSLCPTCGGCRKGHIHCRKCSCVVHSDAMPPEEKEAQRRSFAYGNSNISNGAVTREMVNQEAENMPHVHDPRPMRYGMACAECGEILEAAAAPLSQAQPQLSDEKKIAMLNSALNAAIRRIAELTATAPEEKEAQPPQVSSTAMPLGQEASHSRSVNRSEVRDEPSKNNSAQPPAPRDAQTLEDCEVEWLAALRARAAAPEGLRAVIAKHRYIRDGGHSGCRCGVTWGGEESWDKEWERWVAHVAALAASVEPAREHPQEGRE